MSLKEIFLGGGGLLVVPADTGGVRPHQDQSVVRPGKSHRAAVNADVLRELKSVKDDLSDHIRMDDERNADEHRARILRFNNELLRDIPHTKEEFIDVLADIDFYERYCRDHENYKNNRAVHAIANISRVYDDRLREHDFLKSSSNERDEDAPET